MDEGKKVLDVEANAKAGGKPEKADAYKIRIDKEFRTVEVSILTGEEILGLVGKNSITHQLSQKLQGGKVEAIAPDQKVDLATAGVERFQTLALDPTEG